MCQQNVCGDGDKGPGEACDDGNQSNEDACTNVCKLATCGDGFKQGAEQCDLGVNNSNTGACTLLCKLPVCGDTFLQMSNMEECDDGNLSNTDMCVAPCKLAKCGDTYVQQGVEQCDDGNLVNTDACTGICKTAVCGDGFIRAGVEQCDDGNLVSTDACTGVCNNAICGDGFVRAGVEECDDGNQVDNDMCSNTCKNTACVPTGQRAPLNNLSFDSASGCWNGNPCDNDLYAWNGDGQSFLGFNQAITCSGASTCVANVGITTYQSHATVCQGLWEVLCDDVVVGQINTLGKACAGSAMANGCKTSFPPRKCASIQLRAVADGDNTAGCCGGTSPDSMLTAFSAW
jgi:cysteine-rich repeat protein